jgi:hypothetical protein
MPEPEKRFTVYINCESAEFQGAWFTSGILDALQQVTGGVKTGKWSGAIMSKDGQTTIGNWKTQWRNDDPADRPPPRRGRPPRTA